MNEQAMKSTNGLLSLLWIAARISVVFIVLCGILYPIASTGAAKLLFPSQAAGSLIEDKSGAVIGSELIGQSFRDPRLFHGRVSSIDYDAASSGSNNYAPSNPALEQRIKESIAQWQSSNPDVPISLVPLELLTNSGSGLDPHITPASARVQIPRISELTGLSQEELNGLIKQHTQGRDLGLFGEPRVHVLKLNMALQEKLQAS